MPVSQANHPELARLNSFGLGLLSEADSAELELHLNACEECRQKLEHVPPDALVDLLQASEADTPSNLSPALQTIDSSVQASPPSSVPPLYKRLANILHVQPADQAVPVAAAKVAAFSSGIALPSELEGHARYEVLEQLGAGGMGVVYKARHRLMDRMVALKVVNPLLVTQPGSVDRFVREVKAAAQLGHANIVTAFDAETIGKMHVLVMEYVEGETLGQLLNTQVVLPVEQACDYVRQTALGLQHALERGMVHRDIKPLNLMLTHQGAVKILDFGLARFVSEERSPDGSTQHGSMMGSPDYMAPEQARDAHSADSRADIYSMGCTLYQLLAGQVPFPGLALLEKLEAHRDQQPLALNQLRADVPAELERIVARMMAKNPADRYQTPAEVAQALLPFTLAKPAPAPAVAKRPPPAASRTPLYALTVVAALLLAVVAYWVAQIVLRVETPQGTLIVTTDDPEVQVSVKSGGKEVALFFPWQKKEVPLKIGEYTVELVGGKEGLKLSSNHFRIESGKGKTVTVEFVPNEKKMPAIEVVAKKTPAELAFPFAPEVGQEKQKEWATYLQRKVIETNSLGMQLALIPPGEFPMTPEYRVRLTKPFYLGVHSVTVGQFRKFVAETGYRTDNERHGGGRIWGIEKDAIGPKPEFIWNNREISPTDDHPVLFVSWNDAVKFCAWLSLKEKKNYRLPTLAEREWAGRGGAMRDVKTMQTRGWFAGKSGKKPQPVGKLPADVFGLFDMFGNAADSCHDWLGPLPQGLAIDPQGPEKGERRVQAGGAYVHEPEEYVEPLSDWRAYVADHGTNGFGIRVVCDVDIPATKETVSPVPRLATVEDLLRTREVLTVAQDGSGDFTTIQAALDKVQANQVILIKGQGPYRETPRKDLPPGVALVSLDRSTIETSYIRPEKAAWWHGAMLQSPGSLRISGLTWVGAPLPKDSTDFGVILNVVGYTEVVVENCAFVRPNLDPIFGLRCNHGGKSTRVIVQENYFSAGFMSNHPHGDFIIQRNWFASPFGWHINAAPSGSITIRHNVIQHNVGYNIGRAYPPDKAAPALTVRVHNNVFDVAENAGAFGFVDDQIDEVAALQIANNVVLSQEGRGFLFHLKTLDNVQERWAVGPNAYGVEPNVDPKPDSYASWPRGEKDFVVQKRFLSVDSKSPDYFRIATTGDLATKGAGGDLPTYFGAFPPGPAPQGGDWFTRLQEIAKGSLAPSGVKDLLAKARAASEAKQWEQAVNTCNEILRLEPGNMEATYLRAWPQWNLGKHTEAIQDVSDVLKANPDHYDARHNRTWYYLTTNRFDECIADADIILARDKTSRGSAQVFHYRGVAWAQKGRLDKGLADCEMSVKFDSTPPLFHQWLGMIHARLGDHARATTAFDTALKLDQSVADYGKHHLDHIIPQPTPLAEWRIGREFLTVAQKGPADHRTIQEALAAVKTGQYIKVLDKGPYRETLMHNFTDDNIAVISEVGTQIDVPRWFDLGPGADKKKKVYIGCGLVARNGLRLSGFEFTMPPFPADTEFAVALEVNGIGDLTIESCRVRFHRKQASGPPENKDLTEVSDILRLGCYSPDADKLDKGRFLLQDNYFEGHVLLRGRGPVQATVQRNWIRAWNRGCLTLPDHAETECAIRHNIIQGIDGMAMHARGPDKASSTAGRYMIANNVLDIERGGFPFIALPADKDRPDRQSLSRAVTIQNNVIRSQSHAGLELHADDLKAMTGVWNVGHNCFSIEPKQRFPNFFPVFAKQKSDLVVAGPFLSDDPKNLDFMRIAADSRQATKGAGGSLPTYLGAFPPGPAPKDGDWFTRLQEKVNAPKVSEEKPWSIAAPPPSLADFIAAKKADQILTVAQDGKAMFSTLQKALETVKPGQVIKVLDKGPYRELLLIGVPDDIALVSEVGTRIEVPKWQLWGEDPAVKGKSIYQAFVLHGPRRGLRLSGFEFVCPEAPADASSVIALEFTQGGEVVIENCRVARNAMNNLDPTPGEGQASEFVALRLGSDDPGLASRMVVRDNYVEGMVDFVRGKATGILMERNRVVAPRLGAAVRVFPPLGGDTVIRHNVIHAYNGIQLGAQDPKGISKASFLIANNTFDVTNSALWSYASGNLIAPRFVRIQNNIVHSRNKQGFHLPGVEIPKAKEHWQVDHNCFRAKPTAPTESINDYQNWPLAKTDIVRDKQQFISDDHQHSTNYLRIAADGDLASQGAGGDLPNYFGAFPPGPQPKEGDWFTRARESAPVAFAWPADALREGRIPAPDLAKGKVLYLNEFKKPEPDAGFGATKGDQVETGLRDGKFFIAVKRGAFAGCWSDRGPFPELAAEAVGRVAEPSVGQWWLEINNLEQKRGLHFRLNGDGELEIAGSIFGGEIRTIGRHRHSAIKKGDAFNKILLIAKGKRIEIYVNDIAVCDPIALEIRMPAQIALGAAAVGNQDVRAEIEHVTVRSAEGLPMPEERIASGEVPLAIDK